MNRYLTLLTTVLAAAVVAACGHTNNLSRYDVVNKTALVKSFSSARGESSTSVASPSAGVVADFVAIIGSGVLSDQARRKLESAIVPDSIAAAVAEGMWNSATTYLNMKRVQSLEDSPDFVVETELTEFNLNSSSTGLSALVCAKSRMIDRRTGGIVWENSKRHTVNLSNTTLAAIAPDPIRTGVGIFNATKLLTMSEEEIREVVHSAAARVGTTIGDVLRKDIASMNGR